jgi:hypothetical protein
MVTMQEGVCPSFKGLAALAMLAVFAGACSSSGPESRFSDGTGSGASSGNAGSSNANAGDNGNGAVTGTGGSGFLNVEGGFVDDANGNGTTSTGCASLSGTVYTPGKTDPLYNAIVYIAKGTPDRIMSGASCDKCGGLSAAQAVTATLSGPDGKFKLTGVPLGNDILVVQIGKWRRVVPINVTGCDDAPVSDELTRMPKNQMDGNIPLTAISTGGADTLECILRKMGIEDTEFTIPSGPGRIHMYHATGANATIGPTPDQTELWTNLDNLVKYDVVLLPCEHAPNTAGKAAGYSNIVDYTTKGGRAFITHYNYPWIRSPDTHFPQTANWTAETKYFGDVPQPYDFPMDAKVDTNFQKGKDFAQWLVNVGASATYGTIQLNHVVHNADSVVPDVAQPWLTSDAQARQYKPDGSMISQQILHHYTFNTPVGAAPDGQCGRIVYSAFHVNDAQSDNLTYPAECNDHPLTAQEKVLMFMMFDLASCVQTDKEPPIVPSIN